MNRFFLCDPSLTGIAGHCLGYLLAVKRGLPADSTTILLGNRSVDKGVMKTHGVEPVFTHWIDHREHCDANRNAEHHNTVMLKDLAQANAKFKFTGKDVVLINSVRQWCLSGILEWLTTFQLSKAPTVIIVLHFSAYTDPGVGEAWADLYRRFFLALKSSRYAEKVRLFADSDSLVEEYVDLGAEKVVTAPIPHVPKVEKRAKNDEIVVSYLGDARQDKGFQFLLYLAKQATRGMEAGLPNVSFQIMSNTSLGEKAKPYYRWNIKSLAENPQVRLFPNALEEEEYVGLLAETDVGLVLYEPASYARQTSGILSELVAADAVIVSTRGTWAAGQVRRFGLGRLAMPGDAADMGDALLDVLRNYPKRHGEIQPGRREFLAFHNPENFVRMVMEGVL